MAGNNRARALDEKRCLHGEQGTANARSGRSRAAAAIGSPVVLVLVLVERGCWPTDSQGHFRHSHAHAHARRRGRVGSIGYLGMAHGAPISGAWAPKRDC